MSILHALEVFGDRLDQIAESKTLFAAAFILLIALGTVAAVGILTFQGVL